MPSTCNCIKSWSSGLEMLLLPSGADPGIKKRGGTPTLFLWTAASLKSRASPKKADERGGGGL